MVPIDSLSNTFSALADPTRRRMLGRLTGGEMTVAELADPFDLSAPAISKHLKVLERAGLIERGRNAQWRPCRLRVEPLSEVVGWIEDYRRFWETSAERLGSSGPGWKPTPAEPEEPWHAESAGIDESHW